ncbi:MAG TPA: stage II sporulation protein M [Candidatus Deferrimicrobium sp.]
MNLAGMLDRTIKPYILILTLVFAASFLAGTIAPSAIRQPMTEVFQRVVGNYRGLAGGMLFFNILVQNVMATIFVILSGVMAGILPTFAISSNGFGLGVLYRQASETSGYSTAALKVLPYGVFEIPALLIAASYGLWLGVKAIRRMRGKESTLLRIHIEHAFRRYFAVVFPLLIVAAAIETALILWLP